MCLSTVRPPDEETETTDYTDDLAIQVDADGLPVRQGRAVQMGDLREVTIFGLTWTAQVFEVELRNDINQATVIEWLFLDGFPDVILGGVETVLRYEDTNRMMFRESWTGQIPTDREGEFIVHTQKTAMGLLLVREVDRFNPIGSADLRAAYYGLLGSILIIITCVVPVRAQTECSNFDCGGSIRDAIDIPGDQDCFGFQRTAAQTVAVYLDDQTEGDYLLLRLNAPDGAIVQECDTFHGSCEIDQVVPATGTYTITVDGAGATTGPYTLTLNCLDDERQALACNTSANQTISPLGDEDSFAFDRSAHQTVSVYLDDQTEGDYLLLRLNAPDGAIVQECDTFHGSCEIDQVVPATGTYTITVDGAGATTGPYTLTLNCLDDELQQICLGESILGAVNPIGDETYYVFDGVQQEDVAIFLDDQAEGYLFLRVLAPDGNILQECDTFHGFCEIIETLPVEGHYTITVDGSGSATGAYTLSFSCLTLCPPCEPIFAVSSVFPNDGGNVGSITVTIVGRLIGYDTGVSLVRDGDTIQGHVLRVGSTGRSVSGAFDLANRSPGVWDVVLTNPDGSQAILRKAFTIRAGGAPLLWVDVLGPSAVRVGRPTQIQVLYGTVTAATLTCLTHFSF